jgi:glycerol uptake facilitator-like aquaporin
MTSRSLVSDNGLEEHATFISRAHTLNHQSMWCHITEDQKMKITISMYFQFINEFMFMFQFTFIILKIWNGKWHTNMLKKCCILII